MKGSKEALQWHWFSIKNRITQCTHRPNTLFFSPFFPFLLPENFDRRCYFTMILNNSNWFLLTTTTYAVIQFQFNLNAKNALWRAKKIAQIICKWNYIWYECWLLMYYMFGSFPLFMRILKRQFFRSLLQFWLIEINKSRNFIVWTILNWRKSCKRMAKIGFVKEK